MIVKVFFLYYYKVVKFIFLYIDYEGPTVLRVPLTVYVSVTFYRKFSRKNKKGVKKVADVSDAIHTQESTSDTQ